MILPVRLRFPALGNLELVAEIDIPDSLFTQTPGGVGRFLSEKDLMARWHVSARTLRRLRNQRRLPYEQPTPRRYLYRLEDVEQLEADSRTDRASVQPVAAARRRR